MKDDFGRTIDYLRISLTDRCNFRCLYCMPAEGIEMLQHSDILSLEEIERLARISVDLGVSKIRLTGGEPLVRKGVSSLIKNLSSIKGIDNISMTTNGFYLEEMAAELKKNGLNRLNISLDTVNREKFRKLTRNDALEKVMRGIQEAKKNGFDPIKINTVVVRGVNDDEIVNLAEYTVKEGLILRFIEQMPFNKTETDSYIPASDVLKILIAEYGKPEAVLDKKRLISAGSGPASLYQFREKGLIVGFITPVSNHFCSSCNRLRITADGKLKPCLLSEHEIDLKEKLRDGSDDDVIKEILQSSIGLKPENHKLHLDEIGSIRGMSKIGG